MSDGVMLRRPGPRAALEARRAAATIAAHRVTVALAALAAAVFVAGYWIPAYRYDEYLVAVGRAQLSWPDLFETIVARDPAPGLLYVLMKPWTTISDTPSWTRIPSVLAMTGAVAIFASLVRRLVDARTAVVAGVLLVALPGISQYAQDNRMYALATAMATGSVLAWLRYLQSGRPRWGAAYVVAAAVAGWFHLYSVTIIAALVVASLWQPGILRQNVVRTLAPALLAGILLLPSVWLNIMHPTGSPANPPLAPRTVAAMVGLDFGLAAFVVGPLAVVGLVVGWRRPDRRAAAALGAAWVLVPAALFIVARVAVDVPTLTARYLVFTLPGACLVAAIGLEPFRRRWPLAPAVATLAVVALVLPMQLGIRSVEGHSPATVRLGSLLRTRALDALPVVADSAASDVTVETATYPDRRLAPRDARPEAVALVVSRRMRPRCRDSIPCLRAGSPWRRVVRCTFGSNVHLYVVARPGGRLPEGSPDALAARLNSLVPDAGCASLP